MALSHYPPVVCGASHRGPSPLLDQWRSMHGRNVSTLPSSEPKPLGTPRDVSPPAAAFLRALCDPTRRRIFLALMAGETCNCELSDALGLPQNLVSHHVRKLRKAGFVKEHPDPHDGRWVHIELDLAYLKIGLGVSRGGLQSRPVGRAHTCLPVSGPRKVVPSPEELARLRSLHASASQTRSLRSLCGFAPCQKSGGPAA